MASNLFHNEHGHVAVSYTHLDVYKRQVRKLANAGYVEKAPNPRDRRVCEVRLTDAGRALESAMDRVSHTLITTLTNSIPAADLAATCRTMKAMQENMSAADDSESKREPDSEPAAETRGDHR